MGSNIYGRNFGPWRKLLAGSTQTDMSAPSTEAEFVIAPGFRTVEWSVKSGTGATSYNLTLYRWNKPEFGRTGSTYASVVESYVGVSGNQTFSQALNGAPAFLRVHSIAGTVSADFEVNFRGVNQ